MPYRIDFRAAAADLFDRLVELGALDIERHGDGFAVLLPDDVTPQQAAAVAGRAADSLSPAGGRDDGSIWVLSAPPLRIGPHTLTLADSTAFGTGLHPTTVLCLTLLEELVPRERPDRMLDVGTGSGVLALAALVLGVPRVTAIDIAGDAVRAATENARLNGFTDRLDVIRGGPDAVNGKWPLVVANVLAAPLIEMAPILVRHLGHNGQLVLSGIASSLHREVADAYHRLGLQRARVVMRDGWTALLLRAGW